MKIHAENVDEYLKQVPEKRKKALDQLRNLCIEIFDGYQESMEYGMPSCELPTAEAGWLPVSSSLPGCKSSPGSYMLSTGVTSRDTHGSFL